MRSDWMISCLGDEIVLMICRNTCLPNTNKYVCITTVFLYYCINVRYLPSDKKQTKTNMKTEDIENQQGDSIIQ